MLVDAEDIRKEEIGETLKFSAMIVGEDSSDDHSSADMAVKLFAYTGAIALTTGL